MTATLKKVSLLATATLALCASALSPMAAANSQGANHQAPKTYQNPIIPGFHPDPTIIRVEDDYYLANSSFEWFPAVPLFHSKDLVNWELISYAISEPDYLPELINVGKSRGIYAPTLRYHEGTYYLITTCVQCGNNFYVTAKDPRGPWSKPIWVEGDRGIDPDLFWENGKAYYSGTGVLEPNEVTYPNPNGIWIQEINLETGKLLGEKTQLTLGHARNARWTEGPHIYKLPDAKGNERYMLMVAEGGTGIDHAVTVFDSDNLMGPYVPYHKNPIVTHRNLGYKAHINSTGHADLVQTQNGEWWMVLLGKRKFMGSDNRLYDMLARETFLAPVDMQFGWPVVNPGEAKVPLRAKRPDLPWTPVPQKPARDEFVRPALDLEFNMLRNPSSQWYHIEKGQLKLETRAESAADNKVNPSLLVRRIQDTQYSAKTQVNFTPNKNEIAGLVVYRDYDAFYQLVLEKGAISLSYVRKGKRTDVASVPFKGNKAIFQVEARDDLTQQFYFGTSETNMRPIGDRITSVITSDNIAAGFHGPYVGMYTSAQGAQSDNTAAFDWFEYIGRDR
ncbi:glycoside hydrolase family 43 protein [Echinimonas agarilytica]|uniref:Glycoside hydrolase family 43 protein n=1 Tax=Echinimonas agarilytica TaxID=1215918 RepID=A0AA41WBR0_9GAMM|nr:glycoside hydrolase family 43 protein [Echinimonas agarilytica]MCM2681527.1 glycoside hydrolase family 43 protein [Echinimonas agarilytica]